MAIGIGRRQFMSALGGAAVAWPLAARAQQAERVRRIGMATSLASGDPEDKARSTAFLQGLQELGWTVDRNIQIEYRWGAGDAERNRRNAAELVGLDLDHHTRHWHSVLCTFAAGDAHGTDRVCAGS